MLVNIKVTGGLNIEWGQIDPKAAEGLNTVAELTFRRPLSALCLPATRLRLPFCNTALVGSLPVETAVCITCMYVCVCFQLGVRVFIK